MSNDQNKKQGDSYKGYDAPGGDRVIQSSSEAVPSPDMPSEDRVQAPDSYIGGNVNEKPGSANPALPETIGVETGQVSTADLLRAREASEEERLRAQHGEMYADQPAGPEATGDLPDDVPVGHSPEEAIYGQREFGRPTEPSEIDLLGGRGNNLPTEENDGR